MNIQCDHVIEARRPDIVSVNKSDRKCIAVDIAVPRVCRIRQREKQNVEKYQELRSGIKQVWNMGNVVVVPLNVGAIQSVPLCRSHLS